MKALVLWAEPLSANLGVRALAEGTTSLLQHSFPDVTVAYQGFGAGDAPERIGAARPQLRRLLSRRSDLLDWLRTFDLVVDTRAGDSFADIYGLRRLTVMSLMQELVGRARVPLVLGPQTIGPFNTRRGTVLARRSLTSAALVMARDAVSAAQSARVGRAVDLLTTDVVFALDAPPAGSERRDVIVNPSGLLWAENPHVDAAGYRQLLLDLCRSLRAAGRTVHLLAHVIDSPLSDNDVPVARELAALLGGDTEVLVPTSLAEVRTMIASSAVVIGSRMHACLNALSVGVPAIPLAYSRKFDPLLANIGCASTVDLRQFTPAEQLRAVLAELDRPDPRGAAGLIRDRAQEMLSTAQQRLQRLGDSSVGLHHG